MKTAFCWFTVLLFDYNEWGEGGGGGVRGGVGRRLAKILFLNEI